MLDATSTSAGRSETFSTSKRKTAPGMPESSARIGINGLNARSETFSGYAPSMKRTSANG